MRYGTAPTFRRALEDRLKVRAGGDGARVARNRKRVVFDGFLAVGLDRNIDLGHRTVAAMLDPILDHQIQTGAWHPDAQQWVNIATP